MCSYSISSLFPPLISSVLPLACLPACPALKKSRQIKAKTEAAAYQKLCAQRQKEQREKRQEKLSQRKSQRSSQADN